MVWTSCIAIWTNDVITIRKRRNQEPCRANYFAYSKITMDGCIDIVLYDIGMVYFEGIDDYNLCRTGHSKEDKFDCS